MTSAAPHPPHETRPGTVATGTALAYTPEEAAAIIGADIKPSWLRRKARNREIPSHWFGKYSFTIEDIREIIATCSVPARQAKPAAAPAKRAPAKRAAAPAPAIPAANGVVQLRPRQPRKRKVA